LDIDTPLRELGDVDCAELRDAILAQDDVAWKEDSYRQEEFEVHHDTESIVLVFVDLEKWPDVVVSQEPGWNRLAGVALPVMNDIISRCIRRVERLFEQWQQNYWRERRSPRTLIVMCPFTRDIEFIFRSRPIREFVS